MEARQKDGGLLRIMFRIFSVGARQKYSLNPVTVASEVSAGSETPPGDESNAPALARTLFTCTLQLDLHLDRFDAVKGLTDGAEAPVSRVAVVSHQSEPKWLCAKLVSKVKRKSGESKKSGNPKCGRFAPTSTRKPTYSCFLRALLCHLWHTRG